jgi:hypothetical protein
MPGLVGADMTRKAPFIQRGPAQHSRLQVHFTPIGTSLLNLVERWFAALRRSRFAAARTAHELEAAIS